MRKIWQSREPHPPTLEEGTHQDQYYHHGRSRRSATAVQVPLPQPPSEEASRSRLQRNVCCGVGCCIVFLCIALGVYFLVKVETTEDGETGVGRTGTHKELWIGFSVCVAGLVLAIAGLTCAYFLFFSRSSAASTSTAMSPILAVPRAPPTGSLRGDQNYFYPSSAHDSRGDPYYPHGVVNETMSGGDMGLTRGTRRWVDYPDPPGMEVVQPEHRFSSRYVEPSIEFLDSYPQRNQQQHLQASRHHYAAAHREEVDPKKSFSPPHASRQRDMVYYTTTDPISPPQRQRQTNNDSNVWRGAPTERAPAFHL